jgi:hypothetical protein
MRLVCLGAVVGMFWLGCGAGVMACDSFWSFCGCRHLNKRGVGSGGLALYRCVMGCDVYQCPACVAASEGGCGFVRWVG